MRQLTGPLEPRGIPGAVYLGHRLLGRRCPSALGHSVARADSIRPVGTSGTADKTRQRVVASWFVSTRVAAKGHLRDPRPVATSSGSRVIWLPGELDSPMRIGDQIQLRHAGRNFQHRWWCPACCGKSRGRNFQSTVDSGRCMRSAGTRCLPIEEGRASPRSDDPQSSSSHRPSRM